MTPALPADESPSNSLELFDTVEWIRQWQSALRLGATLWSHMKLERHQRRTVLS